MNPIQFPAFLKPGDRVGVLAPASIVKYEDVVPGIRLFTEQWGLEVVEGKTLKTSFNQFSASDEDRLSDMQQMLDDPSIKAVIAARGGYGCSRIADSLNFDKFLQNPKWIVGFSGSDRLSFEDLPARIREYSCADGQNHHVHGRGTGR
jgi:muramoyltetrapeptide carboxypeptidase